MSWTAGDAGGADQAVQPILMAIDHRVGTGFRQGDSRLTVLGLLREDANSAAGEVFDQPSVVDVQAGVAFAGPAVPGHSPW